MWRVDRTPPWPQRPGPATRPAARPQFSDHRHIGIVGYMKRPPSVNACAPARSLMSHSRAPPLDPRLGLRLTTTPKDSSKGPSKSSIAVSSAHLIPFSLPINFFE